MNDHDYNMMQKLVNLYYPEDCEEKSALLDTLTKSYNANLRMETICQKIENVLEKPRRTEIIKAYTAAIFAMSVIQLTLPQLNLPPLLLLLYPFSITALSALLWVAVSGRD